MGEDSLSSRGEEDSPIEECQPLAVIPRDDELKGLVVPDSSFPEQLAKVAALLNGSSPCLCDGRNGSKLRDAT